MQLTLEQAATRLEIQTADIVHDPAGSPASAETRRARWIESQHLPLSEAQQRSYDRKQHQLRAAVEDALDIEPETPGPGVTGARSQSLSDRPAAASQSAGGIRCRQFIIRRYAACCFVNYTTHARRLIQLLLASGGAIYRTPLAVQVLELERYPVDNACGLALGSYLSQWCGTFYLDGLDHFVKRELKIRAYLRYMDDFVLFSNDRSQLVNARAVIAAWLAEERCFGYIPNAGMSCPTHPSIFLGLPDQSRRSYAQPQTTPCHAGAYAPQLSKGHEALVRSIQSYRGLLLF